MFNNITQTFTFVDAISSPGTYYFVVCLDYPDYNAGFVSQFTHTVLPGFSLGLSGDDKPSIAIVNQIISTCKPFIDDELWKYKLPDPVDKRGGQVKMQVDLGSL